MSPQPNFTLALPFTALGGGAAWGVGQPGGWGSLGGGAAWGGAAWGMG